MLAKENVEFLTVITDGRRMPGAVAGAMAPAVGVRMQYVPEFEQRYGMDELASLDDDALKAKVLAKAEEMESLAARIATEFGEVTFAGQFWHDTQVAFSHEYEGKINETVATRSPQGVGGVTPARAWVGQPIRQGIESANRQYREAPGGQPDAVDLGRDALGAGDVKLSADRTGGGRGGRNQGQPAAPGTGSQDGGRRYQALPGYPHRAINGAAGPDPQVVRVAEAYARAAGIKLVRHSRYVEVDEALARRSSLPALSSRRT